MKNIIKYLFIVLIVIITSCEKDPNSTDTIFYGTVVDSKTNQPIQGVTIIHYFGWSDVTSYHDSTIVSHTDKDGKYNFRQSIGAMYDYTYNFYVARYSGYSVAELNYLIGAINENNIKLAKRAYLKLYIKNVTPFNTNDVIYVDNEYNFYGTNVDTTLILAVFPDVMNELDWTVKKNNITKNYYENIYFTSSDTTSYSIFY